MRRPEVYICLYTITILFLIVVITGCVEVTPPAGGNHVESYGPASHEKTDMKDIVKDQEQPPATKVKSKVTSEPSSPATKVKSKVKFRKISFGRRRCVHQMLFAVFLCRAAHPAGATGRAPFRCSRRWGCRIRGSAR